MMQLVSVDDRKPRILYFEGRPRWEFKFLKRAVEDDKTLRLTTDLRTTEDKMYRQLVDQDTNTALVDGFPTKVQELFDYDALILGSVDQAYLKPAQQELIHEFVDRRGGGLLLMGGPDSLADGSYAQSGLADLHCRPHFPTRKPARLTSSTQPMSSSPRKAARA